MPFTHHSFSIRSPFVQYSLTVRSAFPTYSFLNENVSGTEEKRRDLGCYAKQKSFFTLANKKRDMFVVLYSTGTTILFTRQWRRKQIQSGGVGWGVNPKKG